jgi:phospholipid-binding lipoprotein MlaA
MKLLPRVWLLLCVLFLLGGCATGGGRTESADDFSDEETWDPVEPFNRAMFTFNEKFDQWLLKPVARGYDVAMPKPIKSGIGNFFGNLMQPWVGINDLLQGKFSQSGSDFGRFFLNSTVGILGFIDVAREAGIEPREEDFGQTLAVWGVKEGPYFVWPIIGPRYLRDTFGWGVDWLSNPVSHVQPPAASWELWGVDAVDTRARLLPAEKVLDQAAGEDRYTFIREAYRQRRRNLIYDGNPPKPKFFEEEPANNNHSPANSPDTTPAP